LNSKPRKPGLWINASGASTAIKLTFLFVISVYLWGCGLRTSSHATANKSDTISPTGQTSSTTKIQPCSLITREEARAALGGDVEVTVTPNDNVCAYAFVETSSSNGTRAGSIVVNVVTADALQFQKFGSATDDRTETKPVSGLGDRAVLFMSRDSPDKGAKAIQVLKGNLYFAIGMSTSSTPVSIDALKTLAEKALSRLP